MRFNRLIAACWCGAVVSAAWGAPPELPSPIRPLAGQKAEAVTRVMLDGPALDALKREPEAVLTGFPLGGGKTADLLVDRFEVLTSDARVVEGTAAGDAAVGRPDVTLLRGSVVGRPGSYVFLGLSPLGCNGYVVADGAMHILAAGRTGAPPVVYDLTRLAPGRIAWRDFVCAGGIAPPGGAFGAGAGGALRDSGCRVVRLAIDADSVYLTGAFGGNVAAAQAYTLTLAGAIAEIYQRETATTIQVPFSRVWTGAADPYPAGPVDGVLLGSVSAYWAANMGGVSRNVTHLLTGARSGGAGGIAYLSSICGTSTSFGVDGYINGTFPNPLMNNQAQNWDVMVVAHELGHNFNAIHTHEMSPPVDGCGSGDCSQASQGTIMSYCHTCAGGMSNIALNFHQRVLVSYIMPYLNVGAALCVQGTMCGTPVVNINARNDCSSAGRTVEAGLLPGTYRVRPASPANDGVYYGWSPTGAVSGCAAGCCTQGWAWSYEYSLEGVWHGVGLPGCYRQTDQQAYQFQSIDEVFTVGATTAVQFRVSDGNCSDNAGGVSLRIVRCPAITHQPASLGYCFLPQSVGFSVTASGAGVSYQWYHNGAAMISGGRISGAAGASLTIVPPIGADAGSYWCTAANECGSVTSGVATLDLSNSGPIVVAPPQSQALAPGAAGAMSVQAVGFGALTYAWRRDGVGLSDGGRIAGSATPNLSIAGLLPSDSGNYDAELTDVCGQRVSAAARLDVYCRPDLNLNHAIEPADIAVFVNLWFGGVQQGTLDGDWDSSGAVNPADIAGFVNDWFGSVAQPC